MNDESSVEDVDRPSERKSFRFVATFDDPTHHPLHEHAAWTIVRSVAVEAIGVVPNVAMLVLWTSFTVGWSATGWFGVLLTAFLTVLLLGPVVIFSQWSFRSFDSSLGRLVRTFVKNTNLDTAKLRQCYSLGFVGFVALLAVAGWRFLLAYRAAGEYAAAGTRPPFDMYMDHLGDIPGLFVPMALYSQLGVLCWNYVVRCARSWNTIRRSASIILQRGPAPTETTADSRLVSIAHWTDLHITGGDDVERMVRSVHKGEAPNGNVPLRRLISACADSLRGCDAILITGDTTDAGLSAEWNAFFKLLPPALTKRCVLVPGNHDINILSERSLWRAELDDRPSRALRLLRTVAAMNQVQGDRTVLSSGKSWSEVLGGHLADIEAYIAKPPKREYATRELPKGQSVVVEVTSEDDRRRLDLPRNLVGTLFPCAVQIGEGADALQVVIRGCQIFCVKGGHMTLLPRRAYGHQIGSAGRVVEGG